MPKIFGGDWIEVWQDSVARDSELSHIGRFSSFGLIVNFGSSRKTFEFRKGRFVEVNTVSAELNDVIEISGTPSAWHLLFKKIPEPLFNDILAMDKKHPEFSIDSDRIFLLRNLRVILRLFYLAPREGN